MFTYIAYMVMFLATIIHNSSRNYRSVLIFYSYTTTAIYCYYTTTTIRTNTNTTPTTRSTGWVSATTCIHVSNVMREEILWVPRRRATSRLSNEASILHEGSYSKNTIASSLRWALNGQNSRPYKIKGESYLG